MQQTTSVDDIFRCIFFLAALRIKYSVVSLQFCLWKPGVILQTELNKANDEILARREIKKEQEKAEEMKVIEYMKQKAVS